MPLLGDRPLSIDVKCPNCLTGVTIPIKPQLSLEPMSESWLHVQIEALEKRNKELEHRWKVLTNSMAIIANYIALEKCASDIDEIAKGD